MRALWLLLSLSLGFVLLHALKPNHRILFQSHAAFDDSDDDIVNDSPSSTPSSTLEDIDESETLEAHYIARDAQAELHHELRTHQNTIGMAATAPNTPEATPYLEPDLRVSPNDRLPDDSASLGLDRRAPVQGPSAARTRAEPSRVDTARVTALHTTQAAPLSNRERHMRRNAIRALRRFMEQDPNPAPESRQPVARRLFFSPPARYFLPFRLLPPHSPLL